MLLVFEHSDIFIIVFDIVLCRIRLKQTVLMMIPIDRLAMFTLRANTVTL